MGFRGGIGVCGKEPILPGFARSELTAKAFILERSRDLHDRGRTSSDAHEPALVTRHVVEPTYLGLEQTGRVPRNGFSFSCGSTDGDAANEKEAP